MAVKQSAHRSLTLKKLSRGTPAPSCFRRAVKETISEADYEPANAVASVTMSGPDLAKNRGKERILNLLEGKLENAESTMKNNITKAVYGDGTCCQVFCRSKGDGYCRWHRYSRRYQRYNLAVLEEPVSIYCTCYWSSVSGT